MSQSAQKKAFKAYRDAKHRAERSMLFEDAQAAADAWVEFINTRLPPEHRMPVPVPMHSLYRGETIQ